MKITIIGWYGTETIGDRAILAGLFSIFGKVFGELQVFLGSLHPFFSERTVHEDQQLWEEITGHRVNISLFNSQNLRELDEHIGKADLLCMGGGPLMDLNELFMVEYAFKRARKMGKSTALLGCGIGPLFQKKFRQSVGNIIKKSDLVILRDRKSKESLSVMAHELNTEIDPDTIYVSLDPAVECCLHFRRSKGEEVSPFIAVNLRAFPLGYLKDKTPNEIDSDIINFVGSLSDRFADYTIKLVPMHYFHIGNDDRLFLNEIAQKIKKNNICVQNKHLNVKETIKTYQCAYFNVGMRFHSVVFQTVCSGKNFVLDYTEPNKGKIHSFIEDIDHDGFYKHRYISIQEDLISTDIVQNVESLFQFDEKVMRDKLQLYHFGLSGVKS